MSHLPPYGRGLAERLRRGERPSNGVWIFAGVGAWRAARYSLPFSSRGVLVLPPGEDPAAFDWRPVAGLDALLIETGGTPLEFLRDLAVELIHAGAELVVLLGIGPGEAWIYRPRAGAQA